MLRITFDFDEISQKVNNLKVTTINDTKDSKYDVELDENKLNLTPNAITKLQAVAGDRIAVNYWQVDNQTTYPIISKAEVFTDGMDGNKMTKKGTVSFKGQNRTSLLQYGSLFTFSEFKDKSGNVRNDVFILTPVEDDRETISDSATLIEEEQHIDELNNDSSVQEISEILEEDSYADSLPF